MHNHTKSLIRHIIGAILLFFSIVVIGAAIIGSIENWDYLNSFYMMMMTATTIGFGDITPHTGAGKMFVSFYSLLSVGSFLYIFAIIAVSNSKQLE
jgi:hypothetical protein